MEWRIRLRIRFFQTEKLLPLTGISKKSKNSNNKGYKQWFSLAGKKALNKKQYYSFGLKNAFYAYCDKGILEKYIAP